jgi:thiopurine S-methyltransferase
MIYLHHRLTLHRRRDKEPRLPQGTPSPRGKTRVERQFWVESWLKGGSCTSFHRPDIHPYVIKHAPPAFLAGRRVLVPLCGKTNDLLWFQQHAEHVTGVELSDLAVHQFFAENRTPFERHGNRYEAERLTILCEDMFDLGPAEIGPVDFVYDRAALVALPLPMRLRYVAKLDELTRRGTVQFVNTVQYDPVMDTPPFSIGPDEVARYYGGRYRIEHVEQPELPDHRMVRKFNLNWLIEHGFVLTRIDQ